MSIPAIRINECRIPEGLTSDLQQSAINDKVQEIFNTGIVNFLHSAAAPADGGKFAYSLHYSNKYSKSEKTPEIRITGSNGTVSLIEYIEKLKAAKSQEESIEECTKVQSKVKDLLDSLSPDPLDDEEEEEDIISAPSTEIHDLQNQIHASQQANLSLEARVTALTAQLKDQTELVAEIAALRLQNQSLVSNANASTTRIGDLETANAAEIATANRNIIDLTQKLKDQEALEARLNAQEEALAALRLQNNAPARDADAYQKRIQQLEAALAAEKNQVTVARTASKAAKIQISELQTEVKSKNATINRLEKTLDTKTTRQ